MFFSCRTPPSLFPPQPINILCFEGMEETSSEGLDDSEFIITEVKKGKEPWFDGVDAVCISDNYSSTCVPPHVLTHARRAAELLAAVSPTNRHARQEPSFVSSTPSQSASLASPPPTPTPPVVSFPPPHPHVPLASAVDLRMLPKELALELDEEDILAAGMTIFRCHEFAWVAHALSASSSPRGRFLWLYSQYLAGEKTALRDWNKLDMDRCQPGCIPTYFCISVSSTIEPMSVPGA
jgi:hypothetical protein